MTRETVPTAAPTVQGTADYKDEGLPVEFGENVTVRRPVPTRRVDDFSRTPTDVFAVGAGSKDQSLEPTPDTYVNENMTVPPFVKRSKFTVKYLERNAIMRQVGTSGIYYGDKYRTWIMGCSAFLTFTCIVLLTIPFIALTKDPDTLTIFNWAKGQVHWQLVAPVDWTQKVYLGLGGMTNQTKKGDTYYVPYKAVECTEVFKESCADCDSASTTILIFLSFSMASIVPAFFFDLHRIFPYFDLNFSKVAGLLLHWVFGLVFPILAYVTWSGKCFSGLPTEAIHNGVGRRGIGMYLTWQLSSCALILLAIIIIGPISGILHLLVPTPSWANNNGLKAARALQGKQQKQVLDPFHDFASAIMPDGTVIDPADKPPAQLSYAMPEEAGETMVAEPVRGQPQSDRKASAAMSQASAADSVRSKGSSDPVAGASALRPSAKNGKKNSKKTKE